MEETTLRTLAARYGVPTEVAIAEMKARGIIVLSPDMSISPAKLARYANVILEIKSSQPAPHPTQPTPHPTQPAVKPAFRPKPRSTEQQPTAKPVSQRNHTNEQHGGTPDYDERQRQLLSRDYVIFTYMALRKPGTSHLLMQLADLRVRRKTRTKIVVCSASMEYVKKKAATCDEVRKISDSLEILMEYGMLTVLHGRISEENKTISTFIKERELSESILIVGISRSLHTFVNHRNSSNQGDRTYVMVFERDVNSKGFLVNPQKLAVAFESADGKAEAPYSDRARSLTLPLPEQGDNVYVKEADGGLTPIRLEDGIGKGGEARVYKIASGTKCAKIFSANSNSDMKIKKVSLMCEKYTLMQRIDAPILDRIGWPEKMLYNSAGEEIGYVMNLFSDTVAFDRYSYDKFSEFIPGVEKMHQVTMAVSFAELIDFMHHNNIILCDINRGNILFDSDQAAYLVDLDSAQIADDKYYYPANVAFPEFLPPEHVRDDDYSFKRTKADDIWALQVILFRILTPNGDPFATSRDYDDDEKVIEKGYYPYQSQNNPAEEAVKGSVWHMIVHHFPGFLKNVFWHSLNGNGDFFRAENRRNSTSWLNNMVRYQETLPGMIATDPESGKFIPERYREKTAGKADIGIVNGNLDALLKLGRRAGNAGWDEI